VYKIEVMVTAGIKQPSMTTVEAGSRLETMPAVAILLLLAVIETREG